MKEEKMDNYPRFIVISGLIGVGKSFLTKGLAEYLNYEAIYEPVKDNPYLADFYQNPHKWAYPMQEFLKHRRFAAYQYAVWGLRCKKFKGVVMDRSIHEDTIFASINYKLGTISQRNWSTYLQGFQDFTVFLPEPDIYVFLDASPEICCERTRNRVDSGEREEERSTSFDDNEAQGIPLKYMQTLHDGYQKWLKEISPRIPIIKLDWTNFQTVESAWEQIQEQANVRSRFTRSLVM